jgi:hypothetical protein
VPLHRGRSASPAPSQDTPPRKLGGLGDFLHPLVSNKRQHGNRCAKVGIFTPFLSVLHGHSDSRGHGFLALPLFTGVRLVGSPPRIIHPLLVLTDGAELGAVMADGPSACRAFS